MQRRYLDLWSGGGLLRPDSTGTLADVTGFHAMAHAVYDNQDIDVTALLSQRVRLKNTKYHNAVTRIGYNFIPLVFESYSGLVLYLLVLVFVLLLIYVIGYHGCRVFYGVC
jgi:hypothetical protein